MPRAEAWNEMEDLLAQAFIKVLERAPVLLDAEILLDESTFKELVHMRYGAVKGKGDTEPFMIGPGSEHIEESLDKTVETMTLVQIPRLNELTMYTIVNKITFKRREEC